MIDWWSVLRKLVLVLTSCPPSIALPKSLREKDLNEKIDIFSFGNNVYSLMTGLWPFYENEDDLVVQGELIDGKTAFIDNRYRTEILCRRANG
jgi:hypothetical protein